MADAKLEGKARLLARLAKIPDVCREVAETNLDVATDELLEALKRAAPVSEFDQHPGQLAEDVVKYRNPDRPLSWRLMSIARDAKGRLYGRFVEFGHGEAAPRPWWFPTYRARRKAMRSKLFADTRRALKAWWPD